MRPPGRLGTVVVLVVLVVACVGVLALVQGRDGALGATFGGVAGLAFVLSGPWLLEPVARRNPGLALPAAVGLYTVKAVAALVLLAAAFELEALSTNLSPAGIAASLVVVTVAWTGLQLWGFGRNRVPTYDLDNKP